MKNYLLRSLLIGIVSAIFLTAAYSQNITPFVCYEAKAETYTRISGSISAAGSSGIGYTGGIVPNGVYRVTINPGGATEESFQFGTISANSISMISAGTGTAASFAHPHNTGETIILTAEGIAQYGYHNPNSTSVTIQRGIPSGNYFHDGPTVFPEQPSVFLPGTHAVAASLRIVFPYEQAWYLNGNVAKADPANMCGTINYQGRLTVSGALANGSYDLQFQGYDSDTGGTAQGPLLVIPDVPVINGIFSVALKMGATLVGNTKLRFLEIGVRPAAAPDADPFTTLAPRQPITVAPYAINSVFAVRAASADTATNATNATSAATATTATTATTAATATNSTQLGGFPASSYLTVNSPLGQSVTTTNGNGSVTINSSTQTVIPGLTQNIEVPANSALLINTDGGIFSQGAQNTASVIDIGIFIDGTLVTSRRVVINNFLATSIGNWSMSIGRELAPGPHTIDVRASMPVTSASAVINTDPVIIPRLTVTVLKK